MKAFPILARAQLVGGSCLGADLGGNLLQRTDIAFPGTHNDETVDFLVVMSGYGTFIEVPEAGFVTALRVANGPVIFQNTRVQISSKAMPRGSYRAILLNPTFCMT